MKDFPDIFRTRFDDIVCEFILPARESKKVIILAAGAPGYPGGKDDLMHFLSKKGYWVFLPRYRGTWESDGKFLEFSPHEDLLHVMDKLSTGDFIDLWSGTSHQIENPEFYLIGGSFGGAAAILASRDPRVVKAATICGVVDWREQEEHSIESLEVMSTYVPAAFGQAYRNGPDVWKKLVIGDFYNPAWESESILGVKLLMMHNEDDRVVPIEISKKFAENVAATFVSFKQGGHRALGVVPEARYWNRIDKFFRTPR
ncbi:MAG: hypothetical protein ABA06_00820 [Parcubacteria bacterium C7867-001]|nr:MAG: hypothetical protein ABA06_00820 [Parcubacteria bacterium C7867-001]